VAISMIAKIAEEMAAPNGQFLAAPNWVTM
jgi:hypothetical protein